MSYNEWLDVDVLEDYLDGKLDAKTMYRVEKLSLEDPFVAEALDGLSKSPRRTQALSLLQKQLQERVAQKPVEKKRWTITSHRLSIAAAAAVLFVTVSILFWMKDNNSKNAPKQAKKVDVNIAPQEVAIAVNKKESALTDTNDPSLSSKIRNKNGVTRNAVALASDQTVASTPAATGIKTLADTLTFAAPQYQGSAANNVIAKVDLDPKKISPSRKVERTREVALPGKAEGIYVTRSIGTEEQKESMINGRVYSKADRLPMPGVTVMLNGSNKATTTNNRGEFTLPVDSNASQSLSIAYVGFATKVVNTHSNETVSVELEQTTNALNEVVVEKKEVTPKMVYSPNAAYYPLGGWSDYQAYLINNNNLTKNGLTGKTVVLTFEVKPNGNPTKIIIAKSQGKVLDAEAIRLLNDGPKWVPIDKTKKGTASVTVKF